MRPAPSQPSLCCFAIAISSGLIFIGNEQLLGGEERDDLGAGRSDDDLLLDARRRVAVARRAVGLEREDHALLELKRVLERDEAADDRALVQRHAQPMAELQPESLHLAGEAEFFGFWPQRRHLVGSD